MLSDLIKNHASVRSFVSGKKIPETDVRAIITSAQKASSSYNLQLYSILSITDLDLRKRIAELAGRQQFIAEASLFLIFCADLYRMQLACEAAGYDFYQSRYFESTLMAIIDTALAGQNAALEAESRGYGICFIGAVRNYAEKIRQLLDLPERVFPVFGLCIGYAVERNAPKPRLPLEGVFFENGYDRETAFTAVQSYNRTMAESGIYRNRHFPDDDCERKSPKSEHEEYGWIEHSSRRISTRRPDKVRKDLKKQMLDAGFGFE